MDSDTNRPNSPAHDDDFGVPTPPAWMTPIRPDPSPTADTPIAPKSTPAPLAKPGLPRDKAEVKRDRMPAPAPPPRQLAPPNDAPIAPIQPVHIREEMPNAAAARHPEEDLAHAPRAARALRREFARMAEDETLVDEAILYDDERPLAVDPAFVYLIALFVTVIGLGGAPLEARLTLGWAGLGISAIAAILLDDVEILRPTPRELMIGVLYGVLVGVPALIIGVGPLNRISATIFPRTELSSLVLAVGFAMPMAETIFFRGAFQVGRGMLWSVAASGLWACLLFLPALNILAFPLVAVVIGLGFFAISFLYSYVASMYGVFSAWACQVSISLIIFWLPRLLG